MIEQTYVMLKPDALERGIVGNIITRIENKGFSLKAIKILQLDEAVLAEHYAGHEGRPYWPTLHDYMLSGPVVAMVVEGENAVLGMRILMGPTDFEKQSGGTIRGDFGRTITLNVIHGSDSVESAKAEIARFFPELA